MDINIGNTKQCTTYIINNKKFTLISENTIQYRYTIGHLTIYIEKEHPAGKEIFSLLESDECDKNKIMRKINTILIKYSHGEDTERIMVSIEEDKFADGYNNARRSIAFLVEAVMTVLTDPQSNIPEFRKQWGI